MKLGQAIVTSSFNGDNSIEILIDEKYLGKSRAVQQAVKSIREDCIRREGNRCQNIQILFICRMNIIICFFIRTIT